MAFNTGTNRGRVAKILEYLDLIEKSAEVNKASAAEVNEMLKPVLDHLRVTPPEPTTAPVAEPKAGSHRYWNNVRELCEEADLEALSIGMAIFMDRVHERIKS